MHAGRKKHKRLPVQRSEPAGPAANMTVSSCWSVVEASPPHRKITRVLTETQTECMMGVKTLLLVSLLAVLEVMLAAGGRRGGSMPGSPYNISRNDSNLWKAVLAATWSFNDRSNDAFLFKPSAISRAQRQVVKGLRYIVDVEISRTVCRKRDHNDDLSNCDFQPEGRLHQTFQCHTEVWVIPWKNDTRTQVFDCETDRHHLHPNSILRHLHP